MKRTGSGDTILDWGVVIAAVMLFFKTADVFAYFSPTNLSDFIGWDVSIYYGIVTALLVEGLALALHFNHRARASGTAQTVKWTLLVISGACQVFDGFIVTKTLEQLTPSMRGLLSYGVPLIPLLILVMVFAIGKLPDLDGDGIPDILERRPFKSSYPEKQINGFPGVVPTVTKAWNTVINGSNSRTVSRSVTHAADTEASKIAEPANPTNGSGGNHKQPLP